MSKRSSSESDFMASITRARSSASIADFSGLPAPDPLRSQSAASSTTTSSSETSCLACRDLSLSLAVFEAIRYSQVVNFASPLKPAAALHTFTNTSASASSASSWLLSIRYRRLYTGRSCLRNKTRRAS